MKPETEYIARQLSHMVLADRGDTGHLDRAGMGIVEVHLKGMVREIRQEILVDHVSLAAKITNATLMIQLETKL